MGILNNGKITFTLIAASSLLLWAYTRSKNKTRKAVKNPLEKGRPATNRIFSSQWVDLKGVRCHVRKVTSRSPSSQLPVVLVHGLGVSGSYFVPFAEELALEFDVYVPDLPGHGRSDTPARSMDVKALAEALEKWMAEAEVNRAILIAHSMGCQVAAELALQYPEKVERMVMIGLTPDPHERSIGVHFMRLLKAAVHERLSIVWPVAKDYLRMNRRIIPELIAMINDPIKEKLEKLSVPSMLVRGEHDAIFPQYWFEEAIRLSGALDSAVIAGGAHAVQYSMPEKLAGIIYPFIRGQAGIIDLKIEEDENVCVKNRPLSRYARNDLRQI